MSFTTLWFCDTVLAILMVSIYGVDAEANLIPRMIMELEHGLILFAAFKLWVWLFWQFAKELYKSSKQKEITYWIELTATLILIPAVVLSLIMVLGT